MATLNRELDHFTVGCQEFERASECVFLFTSFTVRVWSGLMIIHLSDTCCHPSIHPSPAGSGGRESWLWGRGKSEESCQKIVFSAINSLRHYKKVKKWFGSISLALGLNFKFFFFCLFLDAIESITSHDLATAAQSPGIECPYRPDPWRVRGAQHECPPWPPSGPSFQ